MSINYQFGDVDAHGATIRERAASLEAEHQAIVRDVLAPATFGAARVRWPARSSSPSWAATSRSSTNRPTPTAKRCKPPATTCRPPTPPLAPAGPNTLSGAAGTALRTVCYRVSMRGTLRHMRSPMPRSQRGPMKAQRRLGLVLSWPWLTAVFLVDVAVLVLASHLPDARVGVAIAGLVLRPGGGTGRRIYSGDR